MADELERLQRRVARELAARKEAEYLLETKSSELFASNHYLSQAQDQLEDRVKERTQELKESEERFRRFIESASDIIYETTPNGFFTYANPVAIRMLNLSDEADVLGHSFLEWVHPDDHQRLTEFYDQQLTQGEKNTYLEFQLYTNKQRTIWIGQNVQVVLEDGKVRGFQAVARDITKRKKIEAELQEERDLAQQILKNMGQGLILTDNYNKIVYANPAYAQMLGYPPDQVIGMSPAAFVHSDDRERLIATRNKHEAEGIFNYEVELQLMAQDTHTVPALITRTIRSNDDQSIGGIEVITNLTDRKRMEETLRDARDQAIHASRMKSEFLANMSHEIRTPLNGVIGMAELLQETELDQEQEEFVEIINTSGTALLSIINDILDFSKINEGKIELEYQPFHLREVIEESLDMLASKAAQKGLELACMMSHRLPLNIIGDVVRVRQILVNLLSNAVKFTEQGEVIVSVEKQTGPDGRNQLHVAVRDTGIGIPEEAIGRLFQSFSQVDASTTRNYGGSGLGLAISKELAELMGGQMWVESVFGKGSTFHFTFDLTAAQDIIIPKLEKPPELAGKRLLIVDDNETNRMILIRQTMLWGMLPEAASSGEEALRWLNEKRDYDLAIIEMNMPKMDGCMLASEIQGLSHYSNFPLIMLSSIGYKLPARGKALFSAQASKPVKVKALRKVIESVCRDQEPVKLKAKPETRITTKDDSLTKSPVRILLTEDNVANQKVALGALKHLGYRADLAVNGREAVEAVEQFAYEVILMDVQMPEMDGIEATQQIRKRCSETKQPYIIAMTANAVTGDKERFLAAGMDAYVSKPVRLKVLADVLASILADKSAD
ncbi:MAG: PAS domain S-box-containing protein [Cellvibrionaceae bacterium]|jgi:PAS domain S-box-containing protein